MPFDPKKLKEDRIAANRDLAEIIMEAVENHADMRFGQLLDYLGIVRPLEHTGGAIRTTPTRAWQDEFYLEPMELLKRVKESGRV